MFVLLKAKFYIAARMMDDDDGVYSEGCKESLARKLVSRMTVAQLLQTIRISRGRMGSKMPEAAESSTLLLNWDRNSAIRGWLDAVAREGPRAMMKLGLRQCRLTQTRSCRFETVRARSVRGSNSAAG